MCRITLPVISLSRVLLTHARLLFRAQARQFQLLRQMERSLAPSRLLAWLKKNVEVRGLLGTVMLSINPSNLIFGESFRTPHNLYPCVPTIDGAQPRNWEYSVFSYFDGATLRVEIRQLSTAFETLTLQRLWLA